MPEHAEPLNMWAIVEVMGHKKYAGHVTELTVGGATFIRVDVPETEQPGSGWGSTAQPARTTAEYSKLIGVGSIYMMTPCTEDVARKCAQTLETWSNPIPVALPVERQIPASVGAAEDAQLDAEGDDEDNIDDWNNDRR